MEKYKNQKEVIMAYFDGTKEGISGNLRIDNNMLIHYQTAIAEINEEKEITLNITRYSIVTGRIQKQIQEIAAEKGYKITTVRRIEEGYKNSLKDRI